MSIIWKNLQAHNFCTIHSSGSWEPLANPDSPGDEQPIKRRRRRLFCSWAAVVAA